MHYRNGREAKNGDKIVQLNMGDGGKAVSLGVLYDATPGNDYCNGQIAPINQSSACLCDCLHVDDLAQVLAEKGLDKRPVDGKVVVPNVEQRAGRMYDAYCAAVGGKAFNGDPLPDWTAFRADASKQKQSDAWIAAAQVA